MLVTEEGPRERASLGMPRSGVGGRDVDKGKVLSVL